MAETFTLTRFDRRLADLARELLNIAQRHELGIVTAESCTGGLVAAVLSETPGAGKYLHGGFVTYTKAQKCAVLDVPMALLRDQGAVNPEVARAMAAGALAHSPAHIAVAVTGVAGPDCDEDGNAVGHMHIAAGRRNGAMIDRAYRFGDVGRDEILHRTIEAALMMLIQVARTPEG